MEFYIHREIKKIGKQNIRITSHEIRQIVENYLNNLDQHFNEMLNNQPIDEFIKDLVNNFDKLTTSDLQGVIQARCVKTKEDENAILNEIYKRVGNKV